MAEQTYRQKNMEKARAKRTENKHVRWAQELREAGWNVTPPHECDRMCMCFAMNCQCSYCRQVNSQVDVLITDERKK